MRSSMQRFISRLKRRWALSGRSGQARASRTATSLHCEALESRWTPAAVASFDVNSHVLTITGASFADTCTVSRLGDDIRLNGAGIAGSPTVTNTDRIVIKTPGHVTVDMRNGVFGPGFTPEATGVSEIEFEIDTKDTPQTQFHLFGTMGPDRFDYGVKNDVPQINLNADDDVDITTNKLLEFYVHGQGGNDRLNGQGSPVVG